MARGWMTRGDHCPAVATPYARAAGQVPPADQQNLGGSEGLLVRPAFRIRSVLAKPHPLPLRNTSANTFECAHFHAKCAPTPAFGSLP
jgi:hypothetical protein